MYLQTGLTNWEPEFSFLNNNNLDIITTGDTIIELQLLV